MSQESELIIAAYRAVLGRDPDASGLAAYARIFRGRSCPEAVQITVERLLASGEYRRRLLGLSATADDGRILTSDIEILMLTYNEETLLPYSLGPLRQVFKNFIFLDMGSTDQTLDIIAGMLSDGAQVQVIPYKRQNLFEFGYAHARNFAAAYATKPWLFAVDADEVLVNGVADGKIAIDSTNSATSIVVAQRRNLQRGEWKIGEPLDTTQLAWEKIEDKKRLYKAIDRVRWEGYLHEDLYDAANRDLRTARSSLVLDHLASFRDPTEQIIKRKMYSWMLLRLYENQSLRKGVSRFWYENYIPQHMEQLKQDAREFSQTSANLTT